MSGTFFKSVRKHIGKLDAVHLREQYGRLLEEVEFMDRVFNSLSEGMLVLDATGGILKSNPAAERLFGMDLKSVLSYFTIPLGKASKRELTVTYPETRTLELQTVPMNNELTLVLLRDVSAEKQRTAEELEVGATAAVRSLAAGVAHEIGNPLNAISLNLQLLARTYPEETAIAECRGQIARLDGIIRGFLQALRPSKPNLLPGSPVLPLGKCLEVLKSQFEQRSISVSLDVARSLPIVAIDNAQMEQVFFNLLKNALEAMHDSGHITIRIWADDTCVYIAIRDSGSGMTSEDLAGLFEAYHTTKEKGNGLGLMICSRIIRDHGGSIGAESRLNEGTTFTITLPRLEKRIRQLEA